MGRNALGGMLSCHPANSQVGKCSLPATKRISRRRSARGITTAPIGRLTRKTSCREAPDERGDGEAGDAENEEPAMPEEVAKPPAEQQEAAERQQVGVDDPGERRLAEAEVGPDRRQRDIHDDRVEDDHQVRGAEQEERSQRRRSASCLAVRSSMPAVIRAL